MARITPDMLCLVKKDGEVRGMVMTIRLQTDADGLPPQEPGVVAWLVRSLSSMEGRRLESLNLGPLGTLHRDAGRAQLPPGTEGWCSDCYLYPLPGLPPEEDETPVELPKVEEREHEPTV